MNKIVSRIIGFVISIIILAGIIFGYQFYQNQFTHNPDRYDKGSAEYAVTKMTKAAREKNYGEFKEFVDFSKIAQDEADKAIKDGSLEGVSDVELETFVTALTPELEKEFEKIINDGESVFNSYFSLNKIEKDSDTKFVYQAETEDGNEKYHFEKADGSEVFRMVKIESV